MIFKIKDREKRIARMTPISNILEAMIKQFKLEKEFTIDNLRQEWPQIAGMLASQSMPDRISNNTIYIKTTNSIIANEIMMLKHVILERCNSVFNNQIIDVKTFISGKL